MPRHALLLLLAATCALFLGCPGNQVSDGGGSGSEVVGRLVNEQGQPVGNATVRAVRAAVDTTQGARAVDSTTSNNRGLYVFDSLSPDVYNLYADYNDSQLVARIPGVHKLDSVRLDVGTDTMHAPGRISGTIRIDKADMSGSQAFIPGTSYSAWTDAAGAYTIDGVPPGRYLVQMRASGFLAVSDSAAVVSGQTITLPARTLALDPALPPPAPKGLSAVYDTLHGVVTLRWDSVKVSDIAGYQAFLDVGTGTPQLLRAGIVVSTQYADTVFRDLLDGSSYSRTYQVRAVDRNNDFSTYSTFTSIVAASPTRVRTAFTWRIVRATADSSVNADSVALGDSVRIEVSFANPTRANDSLCWSVGRADSTVRRRALAPARTSGRDTLVCVWGSEGSRYVYLHAHDLAGCTWLDSTRVTVLRILPRNAWVAGPSLLSGRFAAASCMFNGRLVVSGGSQYVPTVTASFKRLSVSTVEALGVSSTSWDTLTIPRMVKKRSEHAMAAAGGKLYAFGGCVYSNFLRTDLNTVEEFDPLAGRWTLLPDTMPFGICTGGAAVTVSGKILLLGGIRSACTADTPVSASVDEFDPATGRWTHLGSLTTPRAYHQACLLDSNVYVAGGEGLDLAPVSSCERFEVLPGQGIVRAPLRISRMNFALSSMDGKLYAFGGYAPNIAEENTGFVEVYDPITNNWTVVSTSMPQPRQAMTVGVVNGGFFVVGGTYDGFQPPPHHLDTTEVYYP